MTTASVSTRERILQQGLALMSQSGLAGVTLGVLAEQVGMSKSGLFAHFRSKEDVQIELLTHMAEFAQGHVVAPSMAAADGLPRLRALVGNWFGWAQRAGLPGGCPVAAGLFEFDDVEGRVRNKILEMESEWRGLLTAVGSARGRDGASAARSRCRAIRVGVVRHLPGSSRGASLFALLPMRTGGPTLHLKRCSIERDR